jgi:hypothetical protein
MTNITFKRRKLVDVETYPATILVGNSSLVGDAYYLPITIDNYVSPPIPLTGITAVVTETKLKANVAGAFDEVRVGDVITLPTGLAFATPVTTNLTDIAVTEGSNIAMYSNAYDSTTLGIKAGDTFSLFSGTTLPNTTKVDKIDYARRLIYMTESATATAIVTIGSTSRVRVTAVRPSTHPVVADANQIDISVAVTTGSIAGGITVVPGATEALVSTLRITPKGNASTGVVTLEVAGSKNKGLDVAGTPNGLGYTNYSGFTYLNLGNITLDADEFLLDARVPRV